MLDVRIGGAADLHRVAAQIKAAGGKGLGREMSKALGKAVEPVGKAVVVSAAETMPSGYAPVLTASLKHRRSLRNTARVASVRLTTTAKGEAEDRDLPTLEKGQLRHPVFGRSRRTRRGRKRNPWAVTRIRPGFHERGTRRAADDAEKALGGVLDDFAARLAKG